MTSYAPPLDLGWADWVSGACVRGGSGKSPPGGRGPTHLIVAQKRNGAVPVWTGGATRPSRARRVSQRNITGARALSSARHDRPARHAGADQISSAIARPTSLVP